jgi:Ca2+-binding RTX toxin-like protein
VKPLGVNRLGVAAALAVTAAVLAAAASAGGLRDASSAVRRAVDTVKHAADKAASPPKKVSAVTAGSDQYQPGYGFGDPSHNHEGPPGLEKKNDEQAKPVRTANSVSVATTLTLTEQAVLTFSVVGAGGSSVSIARDGSSIGGTHLSGGPARSVTYTVLVPRVLDVSLAIVVGTDYEPGRYTIRVSAVDVDGNKSTTTEAFRLPEALPVNGTKGADRIVPSDRSETIATGAGNDVINTGSGNDVVDAGKGDDRVVTGNGDNRIVAGPGRDVVKSGGGNDRVNVRDRGRDLVNAGPGRDTCIADAVDVLISCELVRVR